MGNDPNYSTRMMRIRCTMGTMDNYINIDRDHGVAAGADQQPVLNANDHTNKNIIHCGNCTSSTNPEFNFRKGCFSIVANQLVPGMGLVSGTGGPGKMITDFLVDAGIMTCKCKPNTPLPWIKVNEDNVLEGAPALTMDSLCTCCYGGVISFVPLNEYPPASPEEMGSGGDENQEAPPADVVGEAVKAALEAAMAEVADTGQAGAEAVARVELALAVAASMPTQNHQALHSNEEIQRHLINDVSDITPEGAFSITETQRLKNYGHNMAQEIPEGALDSNGMIINQSMMKNFVINNATVSYGGCGAIALYNTIKTLDPATQVTFPQVIYWMEPYGILNNSFGAVPMGVTDVLNKMGYETQYTLSQKASEISDLAQKADAAVTLYATTQNVHYVAFRKDEAVESGATQTFTFFNESGGEGDSRTYEEFKKSLTDKQRTELGSITILVNKKE